MESRGGASFLFGGRRGTLLLSMARGDFNCVRFWVWRIVLLRCFGVSFLLVVVVVVVGCCCDDFCCTCFDCEKGASQRMFGRRLLSRVHDWYCRRWVVDMVSGGLERVTRYMS